jgi:hypothetical protein
VADDLVAQGQQAGVDFGQAFGVGGVVLNFASGAVCDGRMRDLILGIADDATLAKVMVFGRGGTAVEVINDKALGSAARSAAGTASGCAHPGVGAAEDLSRRAGDTARGG